MDSETRYADGPGGCTVDEAAKFDRLWDEKKASMSPQDFAIWVKKHSATMLTPEEAITEAMNRYNRIAAELG